MPSGHVCIKSAPCVPPVAAGIDKQYGGHISSGFLHSVSLRNAYVARVSGDYIPGVSRKADACVIDADSQTLSPADNVKIGRNTLYVF